MEDRLRRVTPLCSEQANHYTRVLANLKESVLRAERGQMMIPILGQRDNPRRRALNDGRNHGAIGMARLEQPSFLVDILAFGEARLP